MILAIDFSIYLSYPWKVPIFLPFHSHSFPSTSAFIDFTKRSTTNDILEINIWDEYMELVG